MRGGKRKETRRWTAGNVKLGLPPRHSRDLYFSLGESMIRAWKRFYFSGGSETGAVVHIPEDIDVQRIRAKMNMSQATSPRCSDFRRGLVQGIGNRAAEAGR